MEKVLELLKSNSVLSLGTSLNDKPRVSILEYYLIDGSIIFATSPDSIKAANLTQNKRVSVSVNNMPKFATIDGTVTTPSADEIEQYKALLFAHHPEFKDFLEKGIMKPFSFFKLVAETVYYNDYSKGMGPTEVIKA